MFADMDASRMASESGKVEKVLVFKSFFANSRAARVRQENERPSEPRRWEGVRGE